MSDVYDESETLVGSSLVSEYDATLDDDERANALLKLTSDSFTREFKRIKIKEIVPTDPIKKSRLETLSGLTKTIGELGVLTPIHVMTMETFDDEDEEDEENDFKYVLLEGLRRIYGATRNGHEDIDAIVWDFKDKDQGSDVALYLSLMLNRTQRRSWGENWHLLQILEMQNEITPATLEYLLQLEPGEAMKLKDVMLCHYDDVIQALLSGEKTLDAAYKMLAKKRKEENKLEIEDLTGVDKSIEGADTLVGDNTENMLSDDEARRILEMSDDDLENATIDDLSDEDFDAMNKNDFGDEHQKVGERHPLDPALRQSVLARDDFTCKCCDMRLIGPRLGLIAVHHKIPVHCGGADALDNLITLCVSCHIALHIMERNGGNIMMTHPDYNELTDGEKLSLRKAQILARVAISADKKKGLSREAIKEYTSDSLKHPMPGVGLKDEQRNYAKFRQEEENNVEEESEDE